MFNKTLRQLKLNKSFLVPVLIVFGVLGAILLVRSFAATGDVVAFESEQGTVSGNAVTNAGDATASGGSYVTFKPVGTPAPTPTPSPAPSPTPAPTPPGTPCGPGESTACTNANSDGVLFSENFNGSPAGPASVMNNFPRWFMGPMMQGVYGWDTQSQPTQGQHGSDCGPPPATHQVVQFADTVYQCKDHVMTTMKPTQGGTSSGMVALQPNHMVDLSKGQAIVDIDISTSSPSAGDWWEIWITPWDDQLVAPTDHWFHHSGPPKNALQLEVADFPQDGTKRWTPQVYRNYSAAMPQFDNNGTTIAFWAGPNFRDKVPVSDTRRDKYEVRINGGHVELLVSSPNTNNQLASVLAFDMPGGGLGPAAVVQFLQSSYEPTLGRKIGCGSEDDSSCPFSGSPATWHWDNAIISPAIPYKLITTKEYQIINGHTSNKITFNSAAPSGARMLFAAQSFDNNVGVSFDNGASYQNATPVRGGNGISGGYPGTPEMDFLTYSVNVPAGATSAMIRLSDYCGGSECIPYGIFSRGEAQGFRIIAK